jgi:hypothetical protein
VASQRLWVCIKQPETAISRHDSLINPWQFDDGQTRKGGGRVHSMPWCFLAGGVRL